MHLLDFCTMIINLLCTFLLASFLTIGWPVGILGLIMSSVLFGLAGLYADMYLQIILLCFFFYGWFDWSLERSNKSLKPKVFKSLLFWPLIIVTIICFSFLVAQALITFTDSTTPYLDSFTSVSSLVCVLLAAKKYIENWFIWIVVDSVYVFLYIYKDIPFAAITTFVYLIIAIYGYKHWRKCYEEQKLCS
ncbi:nicotinamide mononucleotide transporter [Francisella sp. Scap27]|nr:nicotinamide riboside transporter PnuC [Francisella sp. Scap27]QLE79276.1 nicotinamide mononucleotide transporter [Francisella sp. Scap27]